MATTTTNFGWDIPQSTDLVKDGATAIAALGQDIDTAFVDLKGGTTGQVLAKASGTDLDFSWVAQDDSNAIQNTELTAKGALISAFSAGTPATLTVGTNGQVLTADSTTATGLAWAASAAGGFTQIATGTLSSTGVNLSGIVATYKSLYLVLDNVQVDAIIGLRIQVNSLGTNIYDGLTRDGRDGAIRNAYYTGESNIEYTYYRPVTGNNGNVWIIEFPNYASTTAYKNIIVRGEGNCADGSGTGAGLPVITDSYFAARTLSAISTINIQRSASTYAGGTYTLYGVN